MTGRPLIDLSVVDFDDEVINVDDRMLSNTTRSARSNRSSNADRSDEDILRERTPRRRTSRNAIVNLINSDVIDISGELSPTGRSVALSPARNTAIIASTQMSARFPHYRQIMMDSLEAARNIQPIPRLRSRRMGLFTTSEWQQNDNRRSTIETTNVLPPIHALRENTKRRRSSTARHLPDLLERL
jgi:hypothetical protein